MKKIRSPARVWALLSAMLGLALFLSDLVPLAREKSPIPASIKVFVQYGEEKNRESYRRDIQNLLENHLSRGACFREVVTDDLQKADLILDASIRELRVSRDYGASLGEIVSESSDPDARTRLIITHRLHLDIVIRKSEGGEEGFRCRIVIEESRKKMHPGEDTEGTAWESVLALVEREVEKRICKKREKIVKKLLSPAR